MHCAPKNAVVPRTSVHDAHKNAVIHRNFAHCALKRALLPRNFAHNAPTSARFPRNLAHSASKSAVVLRSFLQQVTAVKGGVGEGVCLSEPSESSGVLSEQLLEFDTRRVPGRIRSSSRNSTSHYGKQNSILGVSALTPPALQYGCGPRRPKKKNLGQEKTNVRVKKGPEGAEKTPPPQTKALDAARPRVPVTLWLTKKPSKSQKRKGPTLHARGASPGPHSGEGRARSPVPASARSRGGPSSKTRVAAKQKGENKNQGQEAKKHLCRLASKKGP